MNKDRNKALCKLFIAIQYVVDAAWVLGEHPDFWKYRIKNKGNAFLKEIGLAEFEFNEMMKQIGDPEDTLPAFDQLTKGAAILDNLLDQTIEEGLKQDKS